jgi:polyisoprenoid-binding protein YceI
MLVVSVGFALSAFAGWSVKGEPSVGFTATGTVGLKFDGTATKVAVKDDGTATTITVAIKDLETGIGLRNRHMAEDLESEKYPDIKLNLPNEALKALTDGKTLEGDGKGSMTLHGKTKDIAFKYKATCAAGSCDIDANGTISLADFDVKVRSYMGITVKPDVSIRAKLALAK